MIDDRTPYLDLPLPHPNNLLSEDASRLRQAVMALDAGFQEQASQVQTALQHTTEDVGADLAETQRVVQDALSIQQDPVTRQLRRVRMNQLLGLNI